MWGKVDENQYGFAPDTKRKVMLNIFHGERRTLHLRLTNVVIRAGTQTVKGYRNISPN